MFGQNSEINSVISVLRSNCKSLQAFSVYYLVELRSLLLDFTSDAGQSAAVSVRKITPIKSTDYAPAFERKDIQVCFRWLFVTLVNSAFVYLFSVVLFFFLCRSNFSDCVFI